MYRQRGIYKCMLERTLPHATLSEPTEHLPKHSRLLKKKLILKTAINYIHKLTIIMMK